MITEAQLDRALYVFNDVSIDAPRKSVREALREAIEAVLPVGGVTEEMGGKGEGDGWLSIKTAPRDGTWFLAHNLDKDWPGLTRFVRYKYADDRLPIGADGLAWTTCPTHWRPLPAPPSAVDTKLASVQDAKPAVDFEMENSAWAEEVLRKHGVNIKFSHDDRPLTDTVTETKAKR